MTTDTGDEKPEKFTRVEYSSRQRRIETLQVRHKRKLEALKRKHPEIGEKETSLSKTSSKTASNQVLQEYLQARWKVEDELRDFYRTKWKTAEAKMQRSQATQRSETKLIKKISETFGSSEEIVLAYGNWSRTTQMRGLPSSPVVRIKRVLSKHFKVATVDEFRTTGTCSKCGTRAIVNA
eukprot:TRINITY_DN7081_c0_g2_i3.p1 TRINITY_DN7081_c0_g2~~TRINITY_DN7081_c0_g2_i3.p1  ORF type:complete len:180 (-),score=28.09 TRINITY_DN7081_c0_g2_i3:497-1036(-)